MSTHFRDYNPDQWYLLPPDIREWLPEDHPVHHISDLVASLDLSEFYRPYEGNGCRNRPYDPRMVPKVLIHAYCVGVFYPGRLKSGCMKMWRFAFCRREIFRITGPCVVFAWFICRL